jgi:hypothetical protein
MKEELLKIREQLIELYKQSGDTHIPERYLDHAEVGYDVDGIWLKAEVYTFCNTYEDKYFEMSWETFKQKTT